MEAERNTMKIVIVGHVDHGKSTLIGRLLHDTGSFSKEKIEEIKKISKKLGKEFEYSFFLDYLQEEREQSITIDTTQIFFKTKNRDYIIIDAPGHKEFLKNMITGASQAEAGVLIIAANEGIQEQTKRHAYILSLLGIKKIIVLINKMDLVKYDREKFDLIKNDLTKFLKTIKIKADFFIPISAKEGINLKEKSSEISWYNGKSFLEVLDDFQVKNDEKLELRFPIQDVYSINSKRIYVGRIESGNLEQGDEIILLPSKKETKIKSIEKFLETPNKAYSKESIGVTFTDQLFVERGEIICRKDSIPKVTDKINASVFWIGKEPFKKGEKIILKCTTQEVVCRVEQINKKIDTSSLELIEQNSSVLNETEAAELEIKTEKPIVIDDFNKIKELGRFVFEKKLEIVAGGIIKCQN